MKLQLCKCSRLKFLLSIAYVVETMLMEREVINDKTISNECRFPASKTDEYREKFKKKLTTGTRSTRRDESTDVSNLKEFPRGFLAKEVKSMTAHGKERSMLGLHISFDVSGRSKSLQTVYKGVIRSSLR